jgi:hypothetical protein
VKGTINIGPLTITRTRGAYVALASATAALILLLAFGTYGTVQAISRADSPGAAHSDSRAEGRGETTAGGQSSEGIKTVLDTQTLEATLPNSYSIPSDLSLEPRDRRAWDTTDATICQSEGWIDEWCAKAVAIGATGFTNLENQELSVRLISFPDEGTAAALFEGEGAEDEVGKNPPGDQIDGFEVPKQEGVGQSTWTGHGINVRQGGVIAKIEYRWEEDTSVRSGTLMSITRMVVKRIQQAEQGETPTASAR